MPWRRRRSSNRIGIIAAAVIAHIFVLGWFGFIFQLASSDPKVQSAGDLNISEYSGASEFDNYLADLYYPVRQSIKEIRINDDRSHYQHPGNEEIDVVAHCHGDGKICVQSRLVEHQPSGICHEAGHAYLYKIGEKKFIEKWKSKPASLLTWYSLNCVEDDICEWLEHFHKEIRGKPSAFRKLSLAEKQAHLGKLELMLEAEFISPEHYHKFLPVLR